MKVVLFKTFKWTSAIAAYATKIQKEVVEVGLDFYVLLHDEHNNIVIPNTFNVFSFAEKDLKSLYSVGYKGIWPSNHWATWLFYTKYPKYKYYWTVEYDVGISGNSSLIWKYKSKSDYLHINPIEKKGRDWGWFGTYVGNNLAEDERYASYVQILRFSNCVMKRFHEIFSSGENAQDELILNSLIIRESFTHSYKFLNSLKKGRYSWDPKESRHNIPLYEESVKKGELAIYHPVKI
jgi:hypothetical protein